MRGLYVLNSAADLDDALTQAVLHHLFEGGSRLWIYQGAGPGENPYQRLLVRPYVPDQEQATALPARELWIDEFTYLILPAGDSSENGWAALPAHIHRYKRPEIISGAGAAAGAVASIAADFARNILATSDTRR